MNFESLKTSPLSSSTFLLYSVYLKSHKNIPQKTVRGSIDDFIENVEDVSGIDQFWKNLKLFHESHIRLERFLFIVLLFEMIFLFMREVDLNNID